MVRANNNVCYKADYVLSNASAPATMYELIGEDKISKHDKNRFALQVWCHRPGSGRNLQNFT